MLKKQSPVYRVVAIFFLICLVCGIIFSVQTAVSPSSNIYMQISSLCALPAMLFSAYYMLVGYSKNAAGYFKAFLVLYAIYLLAVLVATVGSYSGLVALLLTAAVLALVMLLLLGKNLGKTVSLVLCVVALILCIGMMVITISQHPAPFSGSDPAGKLLLNWSFTETLLACLMGVITFAKYVDKAARGAK